MAEVPGGAFGSTAEGIPGKPAPAPPNGSGVGSAGAGTVGSVGNCGRAPGKGAAGEAGAAGAAGPLSAPAAWSIGHVNTTVAPKSISNIRSFVTITIPADSLELGSLTAAARYIISTSGKANLFNCKHKRQLSLDKSHVYPALNMNLNMKKIHSIPE
ncbi:MAG: hypothetical protein ACR2IE_18120 [Candidatus Sumerlaeaceae bacterium]